MSFRACRGAVLWESTVLVRADAEWLLDLWREEYRAASAVRDWPDAQNALDRSNELVAALSVADQWLRCAWYNNETRLAGENYPTNQRN